jgi:hypothetical protein
MAWLARAQCPLRAKGDILRCGKVAEKESDYQGLTSTALTCRWRSRPQHQKRTSLGGRKTDRAAGDDCELKNLVGYLLVQPPSGVLHVSPFDVHSFNA